MVRGVCKLCFRPWPFDDLVQYGPEPFDLCCGYCARALEEGARELGRVIRSRVPPKPAAE